MKLKLNLRKFTVLACPVVLFMCLPAGAQGAPANPEDNNSPQLMEKALTQSAPATPALREAWRKSMARTPLPKMGCFKASFPSTTWEETACTKAPDLPYLPAKGTHPNTVGNGNDFAAVVSGLLTSAEGSFMSVTGVTSETDPSGESPFSLQLNTEFFKTTVCNSSSNPSNCLGWQQFVYSNGGVAFMQYWLINFNTSCPAGWNMYGSDCWVNGTNAVGVPVQPISNLANLTLTANANSGGTDNIVFSTGTDTYSASNEDTMLNLSKSWNTAEYNLVGDCCLTEANFNTGSTIVVKTSVDNGTTNAPACDQEGFTGETNNLTLVPPQPPAPSAPPVCCPYGGASPAIEFAESNDPNEWATCGSSIIVGPVTFALAASPTSVSVMQGGSGTSTITTTVAGSFDAAVSLSASGQPSGVSVSFNPGSISAPGSGTSTMTMTVAATTATGAYTITVTGTGGGITQTATVALTVAPAVVISPSSAPLIAGQCQNFTVSVPNGGNSAVGSWTLSPQVGNLLVIAPNGQLVQYCAPSSITTQPQTVTLTACLASNLNLCGSATVTVWNQPTCTLTASPSSILYGGSSTLSWTTTNATVAGISNGIGPVSPVSSGSLVINGLGATTTYTMTSANPAATSAPCSAKVTVCKHPLLPNGQCP